MGPKRKTNKEFWVYMLECAGECIYTGIAVDPESRFLEHLSGKGSRFTRARKPIRIIGARRYPDRGTALRVESSLKKLTPDAKRKWAASA
ncbi:MAG: GIY-YIG nuclease family protein [Deltaproteobacteria bacterium]|nr:GIY-YIG nuclease family protein [Deltaproteobacteria bacterium]